jgi:AcrR family transcriptional regulator
VARTTDPRTRPTLLEAASRLFYREGVGAVGVDDVAAASGLSKPTLYRHFDSKEALVATYLKQRHDRLTAELRAAIEAAPPEQRPVAVIDSACASILEPGFKGCAFVRAHAENPRDLETRERLRRRKRVLVETIARACRDAGARKPDELAAQLALIVEGAMTMAYATGERRQAVDAARSVATAVLREAGLEVVR